MPAPTISALLLCLLLAVTLSGCKRLVKEETLEVACDKSLKNAQTLLAEHQGKLDKTEATTIENLLTSAKIDQQHLHYATCHDKASRAVQLLEQYGKRQ